MAAFLASWPDERKEEWEERAAIKEYGGGLPRDEAERSAFEDLTKVIEMARKKTPTDGVKTSAETEAGEGQSLLRATYHLPPALIDKLRDVAWWDRMTVNEVVRTAITEHIRRLEKKRGEPYSKRGGVLRRGKPLA